MRTPILPVVTVIGIGLVTACASRMPESEISHPGQRLFNGYANPEANCYTCHGSDGTGTLRGPSLAETTFMTDDDIVFTIDDGPSLMPSFEKKLTADEKAAIVSWLREAFGPYTEPAAD